MAIKIGEVFDYKGKQFLDSARASFTTIANMKSFPEYNVPDGYITYCAEDGNQYQFHGNNTDDALTGKWRLIPKHQIVTSEEYESLEIPETDKTVYLVVN